MKHVWFSYLPLLAVTTLAIGLGIHEANRAPSYFSVDSLEDLRALNYEHQMAVEDLTSPAGSPLVSELIHADAFLSNQVPNENQGLIVTMNQENTTQILLLEPLESLSEVELQTVAEQYKKAIPEFEAVELDQELDLSSPFYGWFSNSEEAPVPAPKVDLASEDPIEEPVVQKPIVVAVVDSGVDTSHEIFQNTSFLTGWNTIEDNTDVYDDVGHGTHIAGIIVSDAPGVEIVSYKIVNKDGGKLSNVLEALSKAVEDDVDVINTSFGLKEPSYSLETIIEDAYLKGIIIVSAAGNNGVDTGFYPAEYDHTIAVASVDALGNKLPKSNYGEWVDVAAYGYHIRSSLPDDQYGYLTGTSQATAVVSAAVARLLQAPHSEDSWSFEQLLVALRSSSIQQISSGELDGTPIIK